MEKHIDVTYLAARRLIPILEEGIQKGGAILTEKDCADVLFVFQTSVSVSPLISKFAELINDALAPFNPSVIEKGKP